MKKSYLFLMMLFVQLIMGGKAFAADPPKAEYDAALAAITDGAYYIYTEVDGVRYYLTQGGGLMETYEDNMDLRYLYSVTQVSGGALYDKGWNINPNNGKHYTNTTLANSKAVLNPSDGVFRQDGSNDRNDWERQVLYLNEEGMIAIRSCNTAYAESSWGDAGRAFWTYQVVEIEEGVFEPAYGGDGLLAGYTYDPAYIWQFEVPTGQEQVHLVLYNLQEKYMGQVYDDPDEPTTLDFGSDFGQLSDFETWAKFWQLLQDVTVLLEQLEDEDYDYYSDPDAVTLEQAELMAAQADSMYQVILDSEIPYSLPFGDGYYRIKTVNRYWTDTVVGTHLDENDQEVEDIERTYVDKAMLASFENKGMFGTLREDMANQVWYLTQKGDSILMYNAGMQSYISASQTPGASNRIFLTEDASDAAYVVFDWAGLDETGPYDRDGDGEDEYDEKETFNIRLTSKARHAGNYAHQNGHNLGKDAHNDLEVSFWNGTYGKDKYPGNDGGTSEWYLEPVTEADVEAMLENFEILKNHDLLVTKNNELRQKVAETLEFAKDIKRTALITSASQLSSPNSDEAEGTNIGNLIDNNTGTFWHTSWHGTNQEPRVLYNDVEYHYLQISGMENMVGNIEMYFAQRNGATNDHPSKVVLLGSNDEEALDADWAEIAALTIPNVDYAAENTIPFTVETAYKFVRLIVTEVKHNDGSSQSHNTYWHASEIQFYTVEENPNSQYVLLGEIATNLEAAYEENLLIADDDLTPEDYNKLLEAYEVFQGALVDPTEMRTALTQYAKVSEGVVVGTNPGQWADDSVAKAYDDLYAEIEDYNAAGKYKDEEMHKYAVMLKALKKSVAEGANGVRTDKWYRIMVPTEEQFDAYGFSKDGVDNCNELIEEQKTLCGNFVVPGKLEDVEVETPTEENPDSVTTKVRVDAIGGEDLRESNRLFLMAEDEIEDKDASMFRFVEYPAEVEDYTAFFQDAKEDMGLALDLNITKRGEALITDAAQFSSNASYPGNDGGKLESGVLIDGNTSTYWHSDYSKTYNAVPYLQVELNEPVSGFIQVYVARRNTNNGHVVRMYVQGSNDAETWTPVGYIETPYINATTPVYSQPIDLGGSFKHLRFTMTNRSGTDGGSNIEFDPFAENLTADDYNTKFTYFHASEFQVYPVTVNMETAAGQALQNAFATVNKVLLKDVTEEDYATAAPAYKAYQAEFNTAQGKNILPSVNEEAPSTYVLQNKATGLFVWADKPADGNNTNNVYLKTIPSLLQHKAIGYERNLLSARTVADESCNNLHFGESNRRFCTWGSTEPTSNSGLIICEADEEYVAPETFTFLKDVKYGRFVDWCHSVTLNVVEAPEESAAYTPLGWYRDEDETLFLALKTIETIPAGEPAFYIYGDTTYYDPEADDDYEPVKFSFSADEKPIFEGTTVNGLMGTLVRYTLKKNEIYFNNTYAGWPVEGGASVGVTACSAVLNLKECPEVDPEGEYDFSICLAEKDDADGVKDINTALEKVSQRGDVYSVDGKLLRSGATLNSLKSLGKGMYILNGVKVLVK